jgi:hypothetical protein
MSVCSLSVAVVAVALVNSILPVMLVVAVALVNI